MADSNSNQIQNRAPNNNQNQPFGGYPPFHPFMMGQHPPFPPNYQGSPPFQGQDQPPMQTMHPFMQSFMDSNGKFDFNKMMAGMDNINKLINKTGPMIKQLSPLLNMFKRQ